MLWIDLKRAIHTRCPKNMGSWSSSERKNGPKLLLDVVQVYTATGSTCLRLLLSKVVQPVIKALFHLLFPPSLCMFNGCVQKRHERSWLFVFYYLRNIVCWYLWLWRSDHISWPIWAENQKIELFTYFMLQLYLQKQNKNKSSVEVTVSCNSSYPVSCSGY